MEQPAPPEIRYSDGVATGHPDLVEASADWLEGHLGVVNLGRNRPNRFPDSDG
jgi:hypothetical protein